MNVTTHYGSYGSEFQVDEDGNPLEKKVIVKRRGRGRPCKNESSEGSQFKVDDYFYTWALKRFFLT